MVACRFFLLRTDSTSNRENKSCVCLTETRRLFRMKHYHLHGTNNPAMALRLAREGSLACYIHHPIGYVRQADPS